MNHFDWSVCNSALHVHNKCMWNFWSLVPPHKLAPSHAPALKSINKRQKKRADLGQQTCLRAANEHSALSAQPPGEKTAWHFGVTKPQKAADIYGIDTSGGRVFGNTRLITAVWSLLLQHCQCHRSHCREHPYYYLIIILTILIQALLVHAKPCCCKELLYCSLHVQYLNITSSLQLYAALMGIKSELLLQVTPFMHEKLKI